VGNSWGMSRRLSLQSLDLPVVLCWFIILNEFQSVHSLSLRVKWPVVV